MVYVLSCRGTLREGANNLVNCPNPEPLLKSWTLTPEPSTPPNYTVCSMARKELSTTCLEKLASAITWGMEESWEAIHHLLSSAHSWETASAANIHFPSSSLYCSGQFHLQLCFLIKITNVVTFDAAAAPVVVVVVVVVVLVVAAVAAAAATAAAAAAVALVIYCCFQLRFGWRILSAQS